MIYSLRYKFSFRFNSFNQKRNFIVPLEMEFKDIDEFNQEKIWSIGDLLCFEEFAIFLLKQK